ncbi:MAG: PadR family transcriptional regulator [Gemmatimonadaceae bacterium]
MTAKDLDLLRGTLDFLVLKGLSWGPRHGYAVARWIEDTSDGSLQVLDGALYTSLHRMAEKGWIEAEWGISGKGHRAKFYKLTALGRKQLRSEAQDWTDYVAAVTKILNATTQPA